MCQGYALFVALLAASAAPVSAAEPARLNDALAAYDAKDYGTCADTLARIDAAPAGLPSGGDLFYVECLAAAGRTDAAVAVLDARLAQGHIDVQELMHKDRPGLNRLRTLPSWSSLLAHAETLDAARQARLDQPLRQALLARVEKDQAVRQKAIDEGNTPASWQQTVVVDQDNTTWLKTIVAKKGWPTRTSVGEDGAKAAFLIAQHATLDPAFQEQVLALMQSALAQKEADPSDVAMLQDRVLLHQGKPQLYGTQFKTEPDGTMALDRTQDINGLDARRATMGLPPIAEYKAFLSEVYHAPVR
ncbi:DUF6624 domain-containing protein [uncultured Xanthomonas sp.]|uniref:DUF6624 domain-containing protein n=1 Tax=uncultured Xanthomonas sp. TaxID=152831 RepID=UPI0025D52CD0|nr:DUF6624 domain-containing protein [uncultured Xanthomonas sp.]